MILSLNSKVEISVDKEELYRMCYEAWDHANSGQYKPGDNYWMTMFNDRLSDLLNKKLSLKATDVS